MKPALPAKSDLPPTILLWNSFVAKNEDRLPKTTCGVVLFILVYLLPKACFAAKSLICCRFQDIWRQITDTPSGRSASNGFTCSSFRPLHTTPHQKKVMVPYSLPLNRCCSRGIKSRNRGWTGCMALRQYVAQAAIEH